MISWSILGIYQYAQVSTLSAASTLHSVDSICIILDIYSLLYISVIFSLLCISADLHMLYVSVICSLLCISVDLQSALYLSDL